jgi:multicomponent Na+:H+ antiporter subunit D
MILIRASLEIHQYWLALVAAVVGLLTVYSMTKIWAEVFWKPAPQGTQTVQTPRLPNPSAWMLAPVAVLTGLTLVIGLGAEFVFQFAAQAAEDLANPALYVNAVLGDQQ